MEQPEVQAAGAQLKQAKVGLAFARTNLQRTVLKSEVSGTISFRMAVQGQTIGPGVPAFQILKYGQKKINFNIDEDNLPRARKGQAITFSSTAIPDKKFQAIVSHVPNFVLEMNREAMMEATFTNDVADLKHGMSVEGDIILDAENLLAIPYKAVLENEIIWVSGENGQAEKRTCKKHVRFQGYIIIQDKCISPGDKIIIKGQNLLSEGKKLKITKEISTY